MRKLVVDHIKVEVINRFNNLFYHFSSLFGCPLVVQQIRNTYAIDQLNFFTEFQFLDSVSIKLSQQEPSDLFGIVASITAMCNTH